MWFSSREEDQLHHNFSNCPQSPAPQRLTHWLPEQDWWWKQAQAPPMQKTLSSHLPLHPASIQRAPLPPAKEIIRWVITWNVSKETVLKKRCIKIEGK